MKRKKIKRDPQIDWEEKILNICLKLIIPIAFLWAITGCVASILHFTA